MASTSTRLPWALSVIPDQFPGYPRGNSNVRLKRGWILARLRRRENRPPVDDKKMDDFRSRISYQRDSRHRPLVFYPQASIQGRPLSAIRQIITPYSCFLFSSRSSDRSYPYYTGSDAPPHVAGATVHYGLQRKTQP